PAYVQRQLGHASIQLTVDTYGKWLPMGNKAAVDALDSPSGSKVVATAGQEAARASQGTDSSRATRRSRTGDLLITNCLGSRHHVQPSERHLTRSPRCRYGFLRAARVTRRASETHLHVELRDGLQPACNHSRSVLACRL